jgi:serine/threonine protein kinase
MPEDLCLAMEYLPLGSLRSPHFQKPMRELDVRLIVRQVLQGLEHMRAHGFVHRDLKPDVSGHSQTKHQSGTLISPPPRTF